MNTIPIRDLNTTLKDIGALKPSPRNARTHSKKQVEQIAESIKTFGWTNPVLTDGDDNILAGHGRVEAAKLLGLAQVPVIPLTNMTEAQKRAYIIADNKLAENAGWDDAILVSELGELAKMDLGFDLEVIGFETGEIDFMLGADDAAPEPPPPEPEKGPAISAPGDLWLLGKHRLFCGNALEAASYQQLLQGEVAAAMFTDPPYNVPVHGHVCGLGKVKHDEFVMASGEMSDEEFRAFLTTFCQQAKAALKPGAVAFVCMDWRHVGDLLGTGEADLGELINFCVWNKMQGGMGSLYRSQHELIPVFRTPGDKHRNNVELGRHGRNRTNVWDYKGIQARREELKLHPTVKPVQMIADAIQDVTARGEIVLDPFAGSGSTILAAEQTGREARCLELDPRYVDVAIRRYQETTGKEAEHAVWGQSFGEIEAEKKKGI
ncbi:DNA methyltransferase [Henriciella sp.]|uniref:site-specific DNA-methyltransferase n=1 Tax=Henriciella sp. TaxID=1968823 RepID=UPI0026171B00|nr:DNA methyltransferase [Henriciella sp.]